MKKRLIILGIFTFLVIFMGFFAVYGRKEIATIHNPENHDYYIKAYQIGYIHTTYYRCVCILYGPNGEISREYFDAMSTDQIEPRYMKEGRNIDIIWMDDYVSVSSTDRGAFGSTRKFYIDGRIIIEPCEWDVDW